MAMLTLVGKPDVRPSAPMPFLANIVMGDMSMLTFDVVPIGASIESAAHIPVWITISYEP